jgi:hypothetical protein
LKTKYEDIFQEATKHGFSNMIFVKKEYSDAKK